MSDPGAGPMRQPSYTGWQIAMLVIGAILLLPGLCSLVFMLGMVWEMRLSDPIAQMVIVIWLICFLVSAGGGALIHVARRDARAAAAAGCGETPS